MQTLYRLVEQSIMYSPDLSRVLGRVNVSLRIINFYRKVTIDNSHPCRLIDALVDFISKHPEFIYDWYDYPLLCKVALLSAVNRGYSDTQFDGLLRILLTRIYSRKHEDFFFEVMSNVLYDVYGECGDIRRFGRMMDLTRYSLFVAAQESILSRGTAQESIQDTIQGAYGRLIMFFAYKYPHLFNECTVDFISALDENSMRALLNHPLIFQNVNIAYIDERFLTYDMCCNSLAKYEDSIFFVPRALIDDNMCRIAVLNWPESILFVPQRFVTQELCTIAVNKCARLVASLPQEFVTREMYVTAIIKDPSVLIEMDQTLIDAYLVELAVGIDPSVLEYIDLEYLINEEIVLQACVNAVLKDFEFYNTVVTAYAQHVYTFHDSMRIRLACIIDELSGVADIFSKNYKLIQIVTDPQRVSTVLTCIDISVHWRILEYVNEKIRYVVFTKDMCNYLCSQSLKTLHFIYKWISFTREFYVDVLNTCPELVYIVPKEFVSREMCRRIVVDNPVLVNRIPQLFRTEKLFAEVLSANWNHANYNDCSCKHLLRIDDFLEVCNHAKQNFCSCMNLLHAAPSGINKLQICVRVLSCHPEYVCSDFMRGRLTEIISEVLYEKLARGDYEYLRKMLMQCMKEKDLYAICAVVLNFDHDHWYNLLKLEVVMIKYVPSEFLTPEMCEFVVAQNINFIKYVPAHMQSPSIVTKLYSDYSKLNLYNRAVHQKQVSN